MLFAGNIIKHPCFDTMRKTGAGYRIAGTLDVTDRVMRDTFWIGVYPGMTDEMVDRMIEVVREGVGKGVMEDIVKYRWLCGNYPQKSKKVA
jgi:CDP-6-deoxy-D-xylo-4-hexulose-3-dehydrase